MRNSTIDQPAMGAFNTELRNRKQSEATLERIARRFPPCPDCGAQKGKSALTYAANDGEVPCWTVRCGWCGTNYQCGMFVLPEAASASALDEHLRAKRREQARKKFGYGPVPIFPTRGAKRYESDRLSASIRILTGKIAPGLAKRLGVNRRNRNYEGGRGTALTVSG